MNNLEMIKGVGETTAEKLRNIGIESVEELSVANYKAVAHASGLLETVVKRIISSAQKTIKEEEPSIPLEAAVEEEATVEEEEAAVEEEETAVEEEETAVEEEAAVEEIPVEQVIEQKRQRFMSYKEELVYRAMKNPHIRERIITNVVKNLFD